MKSRLHKILFYAGWKAGLLEWVPCITVNLAVLLQIEINVNLFNPISKL